VVDAIGTPNAGPPALQRWRMVRELYVIGTPDAGPPAVDPDEEPTASLRTQAVSEQGTPPAPDGETRRSRAAVIRNDLRVASGDYAEAVRAIVEGKENATRSLGAWAMCSRGE
jgi:hypothetical protein